MTKLPKPDKHPELLELVNKGLIETACEYCMLGIIEVEKIDCGECTIKSEKPENRQKPQKTGNENNPKWKTRTRKKKK